MSSKKGEIKIVKGKMHLITSGKIDSKNFKYKRVKFQTAKTISNLMINTPNI